MEKIVPPLNASILNTDPGNLQNNAHYYTTQQNKTQRNITQHNAT